MLRLTILKSPEENSEIASQHVISGASLGPVRVGRAEDCDWRLEDSSQRISRCHFVVSTEGGRFFVEDSSTNGTSHNGSLIGRGNRVEVRDGDELALGDFLLGASISGASDIERDIGPAPSFLANSAKDAPLEPQLGSGADDALRNSGYGENLGAHESSDAFSDIEAQSISDGMLYEGRSKRSIAPQNDPLLDVGNSDREKLAGEPLVAPPSYSPHDSRPIFSDTGLGNSVQASGSAAGEPRQQPARTSDIAQQPEVERLAVENANKPEQLIPEGFDPWDDSVPEQPVIENPQQPRSGTEPVSGTESGYEVPLSNQRAVPPAGDAASLSDSSTQPFESYQKESTSQPPAAPANAPAVHETPTSETGGAADEDDEVGTDVEKQLRELLEPVLGATAQSADVRVLLKSVGNLASILEVMTPPLMAAIASRSQFKEQMRMRQTLIHARENNPLKVSDDAKLAMLRLLLNNEPGMLHGIDAVNQAFRELANHQTALLAALKPALQDTIELLSPERIDNDVPTGALDKLTPASRKGKLYDEFATRYKKLTRDGGKSVEQRFLGALASEYDSAIFKLGN
ncbi:MAG: type VI secretion system-associated FHA domain protein [Pseudomonadota bacterium]